MDQKEVIRLIKNSIFEWKPFLPITKLMKNYINQIRIAHNNADEDEDLTEFQSKLVEETIQSRVFEKHPPCPSSTLAFIKRFLLVLEEYKIEGHSLLYDYVSQPNSFTEDEPEYYKSYFDKYGNHLVSLVEKRELICDGTTGLRTWQAGKFLYNWLSDNNEHLPQEKRSTIVELGSGVGFTGICLFNHTRCSSSSVILTDHHNSVLRSLYQNVKANLDGHEEKCNSGPVKNKYEVGDELNFPVVFTSKTGHTKRSLIIESLDWEQFLQNTTNHRKFSCDLVIGADIVFDISVIPYLVGVIKIFLSDLSAKKVILANCVRNVATNDNFMKCLENSGLSFKIESHTAEDGSPLNLYLIQI